MKLETRRLILREWRRSDAGDLIEGLNDLAVARWLAFVPHPYTREDAARWLDYCAASAKQKPRTSYDFAIALKSEGKVIGGVTLDRISRLHGTAGGGIWLNSSYHRQGFGTEAFAARLAFAFQKLKLRRIENGFLRGNRASLRMLKKLGFRKEGVRRKAFLCLADGKLKDECLMALLREQWHGAPWSIAGVSPAVS